MILAFLPFILLFITTAIAFPTFGEDAQLQLQSYHVPQPPAPEPVEIIELPLPPVAPDASEDSCTLELNPHGTGCINQTTNLQSGSFTIDGNHILATVEFVGSADSSIYTGLQVILVKTDGGYFGNGDTWRCLTCGLPRDGAAAFHSSLAYPQAFKDGKRFLAGTYVGDCGEYDLTSDECSPSALHIFPIHWMVSDEPNGPSGSMRELRIHPDDTHLAWSSFTDGGQLCFMGRLLFNPVPNTASDGPSPARYDLTTVNLLLAPEGTAPLSTSDSNLNINPDSITIGEVRGFSGTGNEVTYIGYPRESSNIDVFAIHLHTGAIRRLTAHPEYTDPVDISPDDNWHVVMDTRGSGRQMFLSAMRGIPPITDLLSTAVTASTRNNGERRFFQPYLIDWYGDRGDYFGQRLNAAGDGSPGSINDENWNGLADPKWSPDGTKIVYHQALVTSPACGGANPLPCPHSTAPGGRTRRIMLAHLTSRKPLQRQEITPAPDKIPWAVPYDFHKPLPASAAFFPKPGTYTLHSAHSGTAEVTIISTDPATEQIDQVNVTYYSFSVSDPADTPNFSVSPNSTPPSPRPRYILSGSESVHLSRSPRSTVYTIDWFSNLMQYDILSNITNSKITSSDGFRLSIDIMKNKFEAEGWLTSTVDGLVWRQPENGT